jgi:hypothetical protein
MTEVSFNNGLPSKASGNNSRILSSEEEGEAVEATRHGSRRVSKTGTGAFKRSRSHLPPKRPTTLKESLLVDYGRQIHNHLKRLESETELTAFLLRHDIAQDYRAKMVDWMMEVLSTFKMAEQTFFLAVTLLDRFFKLSRKPLQSSELHLSGIVAMFIASKYEDIIPLLMRTVINKIGHGKFTVKQVTGKELEIMRTLEFRLGAPTILEFIERYYSELSANLLAQFNPREINKQLMTRIILLSKLSCCSYDLIQQPPSLLAAGIVTLAVKLTINSSTTGEFEAFKLKKLIRTLAKFSSP